MKNFFQYKILLNGLITGEQRFYSEYDESKSNLSFSNKALSETNKKANHYKNSYSNKMKEQKKSYDNKLKILKSVQEKKYEQKKKLKKK